MNWKIFLSTFVLIFLAELGDKTQLAAMARAADSPHARWFIFGGACAALIASTLVAVLFGGAISRVVPESYIRLGAGVLFVLFGILLLRAALSTPAKAATGRAATVPRPLAALVLRQAEAFEQAACADYRNLAARLTDPALRQLVEQLALEEANHGDRLRAATPHTDPGGEVPPLSVAIGDLHPDVAASSTDRPLLEHAIEHELAAAGFYRELAGLTPIPALKQVFGDLADAEQGHADRLRALLRV